jgi:hypothetical protein
MKNTGSRKSRDTVPLTPVSTTQAELVAKFASGVIDTGGNFATSVIDTGGKFARG